MNRGTATVEGWSPDRVTGVAATVAAAVKEDWGPDELIASWTQVEADWR